MIRFIEMPKVWAMSLRTRAATPSGLSQSALASCKHHIAIACVAVAIFNLAWFSLQLLRGAF